MILFYFILFSNVLYISEHDYTLCSIGSPCDTSCYKRGQVILRHPKQSDIATQHTRRRLFCVYAMPFI